MVLSIISAVFTVGIIGIAAVGITKNAIFYYTFHESYDYYTPNAKSYLLRWVSLKSSGSWRSQCFPSVLYLYLYHVHLMPDTLLSHNTNELRMWLNHHT